MTKLNENGQAAAALIFVIILGVGVMCLVLGIKADLSGDENIESPEGLIFIGCLLIFIFGGFIVFAISMAFSDDERKDK